MDTASARKEAAWRHEQERIDESPVNKDTMREAEYFENENTNNNTKECVIKNDNVHTKKMQQRRTSQDLF